MNHQLLFSLLFIIPYLADGQETKAIYDGRLTPTPTRASAKEVSLLKRTAYLQAKQTLKSSDGCGGGFSVNDVVTGSFTAAGVSQTAYLYSLCMTGHNFAKNGLAVVENGQLVANYTYDGGWDSGIGRVADVDQDGLDELLIASGGTNQGVTWGVVSLIGLKATGIHSFGIFEVYEDDCGTTRRGTMAQRLSAQAGKTPGFFQDTYHKNGCDETGNAAWTKVGSRQAITPRPNEIRFNRCQ